MKTALWYGLALVTALAVVSGSFADEKSHRKAAENLLKEMNMEKQLVASIDQMVDLQVKTNPQLAPFKEVMKKFLNKHMSMNSLKDDMITIYTGAFTEDELNEITKFYKTPTGKKMIEKLPDLMAKGMQLGVQRVQANQEELRQMLEEARDK
jgi:hypothetical protein